ncbi:MAG TPA: peptidylprolyl isomerase [Phycisphaerae bacterium]|nr:peptidylprolyl isomerase [Phycisphaerae bacterium]HRY69605.1 peptidylprolyl isomerase [Phycisphaerae bacterium]HSA27280.1 peptidylprolyl isomerase [Phycisphaerae bacterium]
MDRVKHTGLVGFIALTTGLVCCWPGCATQEKPVGTPVEQALESPQVPADPKPGPAPSPAPLASALPVASDPGSSPTSQPGEVLALVDGTPIHRSEMDKLLYECHGLTILEHLVLLSAAKKRAAELHLSVTAADVAAAHQDALRRLASPLSASNGPSIDAATAQTLLDQFLAAKNISAREWQLRMEQRAYLAKIAAAEVARMEITEKMLREEYALAYGEKVQVRHIQLGSLAAVTRAKAMLASGKDFELVARQLSENEFNAARGGLVTPFTRNDPGIPPLIRETAFSLKEGEVSTAIHEQNTYHLIKLERRFPASNARFESVGKDGLRKSLSDRLSRVRQETLEGELAQSAAVDVRDPALRRAFTQKHRVERK